MGEDSFKNQDQEGHRSLWEMLQCPVRDTFSARSLAELQTPDGYLNSTDIRRPNSSVIESTPALRMQ